ncbi:MAG: hypothetical protein ABIU05_24450 [Nitrospirales bacterium]
MAVAGFVLLWVGFPILRKTLLAVRQRVINANVLLSAGAWGSFIIGSLSQVDPRWPNFLPVAAWLMALHLFFGYFKLDIREKASEGGPQAADAPTPTRPGAPWRPARGCPDEGCCRGRSPGGLRHQTA